MKHIVTVYSREKSMASKGCGQWATSCQSACKTSCTVGNQVCVKKDDQGLGKPLFQPRGLNILLDVPTWAVHVLDAVGARVLLHDGRESVQLTG